MNQTNTHIVSGYDTDLSNLTMMLNDLGTLVSEMVEGAMRSFKKRDNELAEKIILRDEEANRIRRGGSWGNDPRNCRSAYRGGSAPGERDDDLGFRLLAGQEPPEEEAGGAHRPLDRDGVGMIVAP